MNIHSRWMSFLCLMVLFSSFLGGAAHATYWYGSKYSSQHSSHSYLYRKSTFGYSEKWHGYDYGFSKPSDHVSYYSQCHQTYVYDYHKPSYPPYKHHKGWKWWGYGDGDNDHGHDSDEYDYGDTDPVEPQQCEYYPIGLAAEDLEGLEENDWFKVGIKKTGSGKNGTKLRVFSANSSSVTFYYHFMPRLS